MKAAVTTFLMAMVPVIELRGAIPYGVVEGLNIWVAMALSVLGNLVPVPFIILFARKVFDWMKGKSEWLAGIVAKFEAKAESHRESVERWEFVGLMLLVAIPLPGTGAWTGALVAAMMDMRLKRAMPSIVLGVIIAGVIVTALTGGVSLLA